MIGIPVVHNCPYTKAGSGVMRIAHPVLATLAGAVWDDIEWMALLVGKRSENGLEISVDSLRIPLQYREHANCETVNQEPLLPDVVGVVHSHHSMSAFFSHTDNTKLNPRFPTSIVIAQVKYSQSHEAKLLGFDYKAEGRVTLPCGSIGVVEFTVQPNPMLKEWPIVATPEFEATTPGTLYYCPNKEVKIGGIYETTTTKCGITGTEPARAVFGDECKEFIKEVEKSTRVSKHPVNQYPLTYGQPYVVNDRRHLDIRGRAPWDDEAGYLRHWGECYGGD